MKNKIFWIQLIFIIFSMPMNTYAYFFIASPFNGNNEEKAYRYEISQKLTTELLQNGISAFAPILYNQLLIEAFQDIALDDRRELLMPMNMNFLYKSNGMILLMIPGWDQSWGINHYIEQCKERNIPIFKVKFNQTDYDLNALISQLRQ
jgi:hypothetical protein